MYSISESFLKDPTFFGTGDFSRSNESTRNFGSNDMVAVTIDTYESGVMGFASMMSPDAGGYLKIYIRACFVYLFLETFVSLYSLS